MEIPDPRSETSIEERRAATRRTVLNRANGVMNTAFENQRLERGRHPDLHYVIRQTQFATPCDVVELRVDTREFPDMRTDRVRLYRPVIDPAHLGYERSVDYWVELAVTNNADDSESVKFVPGTPGLFLELNGESELIVDVGSKPSSTLTEFPQQMDISSGNIMLVTQGLIEQNSDNIVPRHGFPPPSSDELTAA